MLLIHEWLELRPVLVNGVLYASRRLTPAEEPHRAAYVALSEMVAEVIELDITGMDQEPRQTVYACTSPGCAVPVHSAPDTGPTHKHCPGGSGHRCIRTITHPRRNRRANGA